MAFAPKASEVHAFVFTPLTIKSLGLDGNQEVKIKQAIDCFWNGLANDKKVSKEFKKFIKTHP